MTEDLKQTARKLLHASYLLVLAAKPSKASKVQTAIRSLTQAQSNVATALTKLQSAAKAIDIIEPILKNSPEDKVKSIEAFRKFYSEISSKLNDLTASLAAVNSELMPLSVDVEPPAQPAAPAQPPNPPAQAPAQPKGT